MASGLGVNLVCRECRWVEPQELKRESQREGPGVTGLGAGLMVAVVVRLAVGAVVSVAGPGGPVPGRAVGWMTGADMVVGENLNGDARTRGICSVDKIEL